MRSLESNGRIAFTALLFVGLGLTACGGGAASSPQPATAGGNATAQTSTTAGTAADEDELSASVMEHHGHHHGGFTHLIVMSVETLGGTPEQHDKIEKVRADLQAKLMPVHEANKNLLAVLADVLADGTASPEETAKVDAAVAKLSEASSSAHAASSDALNQLHSILDASQRAALVEKVQANWQVWRQANADEDKDNNGLPDAEEGRLVRMTKMLALTPDQVTKIKGGLTAGMANPAHKLDSAEVDAHLKTFGDAFVKESFDAKSLHGEGVNAHLSSAGAARMARFYTVLAPVLTADQRTKLVEHFRKHENKGQNFTSSST